MIFEIISTGAEDETIWVAMDPDTFNTIHKMIVVEAYRKGQKEQNRNLTDDE